MWLLVALDDRALKYDEAYKIHYVDGQPAAEYYFDEKIAQALEDDGFLTEMWDKFDAMFDWGDFDFFEPDKCVKFREWLLDRMKRPMNANFPEQSNSSPLRKCPKPAKILYF
mgnify:FL=1|jgi:hypothetical protein